MELNQSLSTQQVQTLSGQMLASLNILAMSNRDLGAFLAEKALANPAISYSAPRVSASGGAEFDAVAALAAEKPSLYGHLEPQIALAFPSARDRRAAAVFLDALDPSGWLGRGLPEIAAEAGLAPDEAAAMLSRLQGLEPTGLFARSLGECLRLQAEEHDILTWELSALLDNLPLLGEGRLRELAEICDCEPGDIADIARPLRQFDPKPGLAFATDRAPIFPPDLIARRDGGRWIVELNRATSPVISVDPTALPDAASTEARRFCRAAVAEARMLAQALDKRGETLLRTATVLVARQTPFLERGRRHLTPLSLQDVADALDLHPSTISRATAGRMVDTPGGAIPLKTFFSRATAGAHPDTLVSQDAALDFVERTVRAEPPQAPFSDDEIARMADASGFAMARRTVAKYRKRLGIASSYRRKSVPALAG